MHLGYVIVCVCVGCVAGRGECGMSLCVLYYWQGWRYEIVFVCLGFVTDRDGLMAE